MIRLVRTTIALGGCMAALAAAPQKGGAQRLQYAYRGGDTARFIETMDVNGTSTGRGGTLTIGITREAKISLAFTASDTVRAWYDSLTMEATGPTAPRRAETQSVIRVPFVLRVQRDGQLKTLLTPTMPDIVRQLAEFYPQFDDFLPLLPAGNVGAARADTIHRRETVGDRRIVLRRVIRSRIERDTIFGAQPAIVINIRSTLRVEVSTGDPKGEFSAEMVLEGTETGFAVVSKTGALLQRSRRGDASGSTMYRGRGAQVSVPQTYTYRTMIRAVEK